MSIKRVVDVDFWNDNKVIDMFSPEDKYFMLYLLTNPHTTQLGIYEFNIKKAGFELGHSDDTIRVLLDRFENKYGMIKYSKSTSEIAIKNFLRHSIIKGGKPVEDLLIKEIGNVKDKSLIDYVFDNLLKHENLNETVKKVIVLYNDNVNNNDNDNDNEVSYHDSYHDSSEPVKEQKHKHGEYQHVLLKDTELDRLNSEFGEPNTKAAIKYLDEYIEMKGYKAKNHNLCIRKWVFDAVKRNNQSQSKPSQPKRNQFNQFPQREYTSQDFAEMEQKLINKGIG
jgi:hypothetical protein